jgi:Apea-like HEPN
MHSGLVGYHRDRGGFWLVAESLDLRVTLPYEISPSLRLAKATDQQRKYIDELSERVIGRHRVHNHYSHDFRVRPQVGGVGIYTEQHPIPEAEWRYYILAYHGDGKDVGQFCLAANLGEPPLTFFLCIETANKFGDGPMEGTYGDYLQVVEWYASAVQPRTVVFDDRGIAQIVGAYGALQKLNPDKFQGIRRALQAFQDLKRLPSMSDFAILGLFAIIEMLITHDPKGSFDSLVHQIKTKVALLSLRLGTAFDYSAFGNNQINPDKIWGALYELRSLVAHGGEVNFKNKDLKHAIDRDTAINFLKEATRRLLRHALEDPTLIESLKPI